MEGGFSNPQLKKAVRKPASVGNLEAKVKSFCAVPQVLRFLKDFILFAEKKRSCKSSSCGSIRWRVDKVVARALDPQRSRGLSGIRRGAVKLTR